MTAKLLLSLPTVSVGDNTGNEEVREREGQQLPTNILNGDSLAVSNSEFLH